MEIWDYVSSATETISGGVTRTREIVGGAAGKARAAAPDLSGVWKNTRDLAKVALETAVWTSQEVVERMPDREGWQRFGRLGLRIADHAIDEGTKPYTVGVPVYKFAKEELSKNKSQEQPVKEKTENTELAKLKATTQNLEKKNMELEELRARMECVENRMKREEEGCAVINGLGLGGPYPVNNKTKTQSLNGGTAVVELKKDDTRRLRPGTQKVRIDSVDVNKELSYIDGDHLLHRCFLTIETEMERELE